MASDQPTTINTTEILSLERAASESIDVYHNEDAHHQSDKDEPDIIYKSREQDSYCSDYIGVHENDYTDVYHSEQQEKDDPPR